MRRGTTVSSKLVQTLLVTKQKQKTDKENLSAYVQAAFSQITGSLGPPQLGQGSSSAGAGPSSGPSAVVDLGVVGRGTKRVTPQPLPTLPPTAGCHAPSYTCCLLLQQSLWHCHSASNCSLTSSLMEGWSRDHLCCKHALLSCFSCFCTWSRC